MKKNIQEMRYLFMRTNYRQNGLLLVLLFSFAALFFCGEPPATKTEEKVEPPPPPVKKTVVKEEVAGDPRINHLYNSSGEMKIGNCVKTWVEFKYKQDVRFEYGKKRMKKIYTAAIIKYENFCENRQVENLSINITDTLINKKYIGRYQSSGLDKGEAVIPLDNEVSKPDFVYRITYTLTS